MSVAPCPRAPRRSTPPAQRLRGAARLRRAARGVAGGDAVAARASIGTSVSSPSARLFCQSAKGRAMAAHSLCRRLSRARGGAGGAGARRMRALFAARLGFSAPLTSWYTFSGLGPETNGTVKRAQGGCSQEDDATPPKLVPGSVRTPRTQVQQINAPSERAADSALGAPRPPFLERSTLTLSVPPSKPPSARLSRSGGGGRRCGGGRRQGLR